MPIYEYRCESCGSTIEVLQKFSDPAPTECESCHKGPLTKQVSMSSFALKGNGWYVTDFKGGTRPKEAAEAPAAAPIADKKPTSEST